MLNVAKRSLPQLQQEFRARPRNMDDPDEAAENLLGDAVESNLTTVAGVIAQEEVVRLRRLIFRATKGKSFIHVETF